MEATCRSLWLGGVTYRFPTLAFGLLEGGVAYACALFADFIELTNRFNDGFLQDIRALLSRNTDRSKLVRLLPADAKVAHKSGWYESVANDVGIVTVDRVPTRPRPCSTAADSRTPLHGARRPSAAL